MQVKPDCATVIRQLKQPEHFATAAQVQRTGNVLAPPKQVRSFHPFSVGLVRTQPSVMYLPNDLFSTALRPLESNEKALLVCVRIVLLPERIAHSNWACVVQAEVH